MLLRIEHFSTSLMSLLTLDIFNKKDPYFLEKTKLFEKIFLQKQLVLGTWNYFKKVFANL